MPDLAQATPSHYIENKSNNILITVCHTMQQPLTNETGEPTGNLDSENGKAVLQDTA